MVTRRRCPLSPTQGVGRRYAHVVLRKADIDLTKRAGELTEDEVSGAGGTVGTPRGDRGDVAGRVGDISEPLGTLLRGLGTLSGSWGHTRGTAGMSPRWLGTSWRGWGCSEEVGDTVEGHF